MSTTPETHVIEQLSAYVDGMIPETERPGIDAHLILCPGCERRYQELLHLRKAMHEQPTYTPPESFYQGALARINAEARHRHWLTGYLPQKAVASVCLLMIVVWVTRKEPVQQIPVQAPPPLASLDTQMPKPPEPAKEKEASPVPPTPLIAEVEKKLEASKPEVEVPPAPPTPPALAKVKKAERHARAKVAMGYGQPIRPPAASGPALGGMHPVPKSNIKAVDEVSVSGRKDSPMDVRLPVVVTKSVPSPLVEWKGVDSGIKKFKTYIIRSPEELQDLWALHAPDAQVSVVDFEHYLVVGITSGLTHEKGQGMELMGTRDTTDALIIYYREAADLFRKSPTMATYTPYHFKVIPKTNLPIQFQKI